MMSEKRQDLIPSSDLSEFYTKKIAISLTIIYNYRDNIENNKRLIIIINKELDEIYKQIRNRLIKHELKDLVENYTKFNNALNKLSPLTNTHIKDPDSGDRVRRVTISRDYKEYSNIITEKECLIWECLDALGLLGQMEIKSKRLR